MTHPSFDAPSTETLNKLLPAFDFKSLIASHDLGAVYLANQRSLERDVAIKILSPHISTDPAFRKSFESTARSMAKLNHPNLIRVFDSGSVEKMLYFVMEFVPGKSLERSASGHLVEFGQALGLVNGICAGLANAHRHGIYHGSLDLACILLNRKAEPKIGNFGFTHPSSSADSPSPSTAPELHSGNQDPDAKADVYSVGALFYQLLTDQPHSPDAAPASELSSCPSKLDDILDQACHSDPRQRFQDVDSLRHALEGLRKNPHPTKSNRAPVSEVIGVNRNKKLQPSGKAPAIPAKRVPSAKVGFNWKLLRNLVIIAALLLAISAAWDNLKSVRSTREQENQKVAEKDKASREKAIAEARRAAEEKLAKRRAALETAGTGNSAGNATPPVDIPIESPSQSLARLRDALAAGQRDEIPAGSNGIGTNDYFLVTTPMTWQQAAAFAENHGAHLAVPNASADVTWLSGNFPIEDEIWLGAGTSGRNLWTLADGTPWAPAKKPSGSGQYLVLNRHGILRAGKMSEKLPFLIQWHHDGTNPGSLEDTLSAARNTLGSPTPAYPPGTRAIGSRHYLALDRPITFEQADRLAKKSGGHLATTADTSEIHLIAGLVEDLNAPNGLWLGGRCLNEQWTWTTGEPWKDPKWAAPAAAGTTNAGLVIQPGLGLLARPAGSPASGFIIEWSHDAGSQPAAGGNTAQPGNSIPELQIKATALLGKLDQKRNVGLKANARSYEWDLDLFLRGLSHGDQARWAPHVNRLKNCVTNNRVPANIPADSGIEVTKKMLDTAKHCARKQAELDEDFLTEAEKIRAAFASRVKDALANARQTGQSTLAESLANTLTEATYLDSWVRQLGIEPKPENPNLAEAAAPRGQRKTTPGTVFE